MIINACENGRLEVVNRLLDEADIHASNEKAFRIACRNGHLEVVNRLLELEGPDRPNIHANNDYAYIWACRNGHIDVVNRLLELEGHDRPNIHVNGENAFRNACRNGHINVVNRLLELKRPYSYFYAFKFACFNGHLEIVDRLLLELTPDHKFVIYRGFMFAVCKGHLNVVNRLLETGYFIEKAEFGGYVHDGFECTCKLIYYGAYCDGHIEVVKRLLYENPVGNPLEIPTKYRNDVEELLEKELRKFRKLKILLENVLYENTCRKILEYIYPWEMKSL
jgi:hypothetical protein